MLLVIVQLLSLSYNTKCFWCDPLAQQMLTHVRSSWCRPRGLWSTWVCPLRCTAPPLRPTPLRWNCRRTDGPISRYDRAILCLRYEQYKHTEIHIKACVSVCMPHQCVPSPNSCLRDPMMIFSTLSSVLVTRSTVELFVMTLISLSPAFLISWRNGTLLAHA